MAKVVSAFGGCCASCCLAEFPVQNLHHRFRSLTHEQTSEGSLKKRPTGFAYLRITQAQADAEPDKK